MTDIADVFAEERRSLAIDAANFALEMVAASNFEVAERMFAVAHRQAIWLKAHMEKTK